MGDITRASQKCSQPKPQQLPDKTSSAPVLQKPLNGILWTQLTAPSSSNLLASAQLTARSWCIWNLYHHLWSPALAPMCICNVKCCWKATLNNLKIASHCFQTKQSFCTWHFFSKRAASQVQRSSNTANRSTEACAQPRILLPPYFPQVTLPKKKHK